MLIQWLRSRINEPTRNYVWNCYNLVLRACVTALAWALLLGLSLLINLVIELSLKQLGASEPVQTLMSNMAISYMAVMAIAILIMNVSDAMILVGANFASARGVKEEDGDEADR